MVETQNGAVVIGPSKSGKSTLIGVLGTHVGDAVGVKPANEQTARWFRRMRAAIVRGQLLDASEAVEEYRFRVGNTEFSLADTPGGSIFGNHQTRTHALAQVNAAPNLLLCVDPTSRENINKMLVDLLTMLDELPAKTWSRVAICATKADIHFAEAAWRDRSLLPKIAAMEPDFTTFSKKLANVISHLRKRSAVSRVLWVSAFGFARNDGAPNYDVRTGRLRVGLDWDEHDTEPRIPDLNFLLDNWEPINPLVPFRFLAGVTPP